MQNTENKTKKFVALATYVVAVLCLLAGLFLPLFNGKEILAFQIPEAFKCLLGKGSADAKYPFAFTDTVSLFGIEKLSFNFIALTVVLYTAVSALALLSFVPVALSVRKEGKVANKFYYAIEIAAVAVLALFLLASLEAKVCYNTVIAIGGTTVALIVLCGLDKGKASAVKIALFILSAVAFLALFDFVALLSKQEAFKNFTDKISSGLVAEETGTLALNGLFAAKLSEIFATLPEAKQKALFLAEAIAATVVLLNFIIDTIKLGTGKDKKFGRIFDIARYGLEFAVAACVLVIALICKSTVGIMLIAIMAVAAVQLAIVIIRFIKGLVKKPDNERSADEDETDDYGEETSPATDDAQPEFNENIFAESYEGEEAQHENGDSPDENKDGYVTPDDGYTAPDNDGYVSPEEDYVEQQAAARESEAENSGEPAEEKPAEDEITRFYEPEKDTSYLLTEEQIPAKEETEASASDEPENEETAAEEAVEELADEPADEPSRELAPDEEPIDEEPVSETPVAEEESYKEESNEEEPYVKESSYEEEKTETPEEKVEPDSAEKTTNPYRNNIKPYNPYERHNPFRNFEEPPQSVQPYNPYAQTAKRETQEAKPVQPVYERSAPAEPKERSAPQTFRPYEKPAERPQSAKPLQPRPIIQEFKPVPPISEQPPKDPHVYTIDTIYAGPTDDFIRKLSNDERIEFARTFIEKNRGDLGNIPDYNVGGDNKKFFSVAFIYLGRIRGLVSDGLLNKMYKELNML